MTSVNRDCVSTDQAVRRETSSGQMYVAVVGIDHYRDPAWSRLHRAVSDARGARDTFVRLGFREACPALLDHEATGAALQRLATDELRALGSEDSLVVFFAGHGHTVPFEYPDGMIAKRGYLVPADGAPPGSGAGSWVSLDSWLHELAHLPPKHILVVIDACHSGIALNPVIRWRGTDVRTSEPLARLRERRSRRIITSALDDQLAMDSGPIEGHSLFTGCLIEALTGGFKAKTGQPTATGSEIAMHVQRRVSSFPGGQQTPDFGALALDARGELIVDLAGPRSDDAPRMLERTQHVGVDGILPKKYQSGDAWPKLADRFTSTSPSRGASSAESAPLEAGVDSIKPKRARTDPPTNAASNAAIPDNSPPRPAVDLAASAKEAPVQDHRPRRTPSPSELAFLAALDRHQEMRQRGGRVLSFVTADSTTAATSWASWAASRGHLTLLTEATGLSTATASLLEQMPWLRLLRSARDRLAAAAKLDASAVDAALGRGSPEARQAWVDDVADHDIHARVGGWLLSMIREPWGHVPDLTTAPIRGSDLLASLCELAAPIAVLLHHPEPTGGWLERAIHTAAELVEFLPQRAIAISAPRELASSVLRTQSDSAAIGLARQGEVPLGVRPVRTSDVAGGHAVRALHAALERDPRTAGLFKPTAWVPTHDRDRLVQVDLIAGDALLAIEIDDWYQHHDPTAYEHDRRKDVWLSRAMFFVMRFLVEDVEERLEQTIEEIALGLSGRRASGTFWGDANDKQS